MATAELVAALQRRFPGLGFADKPLITYPDGRESDQRWVCVPAERIVEVCEFLRDDPACLMEMLIDVTCVDYLNFPEADDRFGVIYSLLSLTYNHRLWLKVFVNDPDPVVPSVTGVWKGANWTEREVYDMFGIRFSGHPDLRRILCPDDFQDHALRKDYPLRGKGERERFVVLDKTSA